MMSVSRVGGNFKIRIANNQSGCTGSRTDEIGIPGISRGYAVRPVGNCAVVSVAIRFFSWTGTPKAVLPVKNWTVPVGSIAPLGSTMACRTTELFGKAPVGRKRIVCVGPLATLTEVMGPAVLAEKLASPE